MGYTRKSNSTGTRGNQVFAITLGKKKSMGEKKKIFQGCTWTCRQTFRGPKAQVSAVSEVGEIGRTHEKGVCQVLGGGNLGKKIPPLGHGPETATKKKHLDSEIG